MIRNKISELVMRKRRLIIIFLGIVCLLSLLFSLALIWKPNYIFLPIQSVSSLKGQGDWMKVEYSHLKMSNGDFYIVKRFEIVFTHDKDENFYSQEAIISYYDTWLKNHGWSTFMGDLPQPCVNFLPESEFLSQGVNKIGVTTYFRRNSKDAFLNQPTICFAIWADETTKKNSVVLLTANPSILTTVFNILR